MKYLDVMVASWACEVSEILTQRTTQGSLYYERVPLTSQAQLATIHMLCLDIYKKSFLPMSVDIV